MTNESYEVVKKLQKLYSWLDFYKQNQRFQDIEKTQNQIKEFKISNNLN